MSSAGSKQPSFSSPTPSSQSSKTEKEKGKLHIVIAPNGSVVGNNSRKWSNRCGDFVRACVPVHYPDWRQVPKNFKDDVWRNLMDEFALDIPEEVARPMLEKGWSQKFRTYKTTLRKSLESEKEEAPRGMDPNHWKEFSENENKPKKKEQKIKNAENRAQLQYSHCLGRYSYAQKTYELVSVKGDIGHKRNGVLPYWDSADLASCFHLDTRITDVLHFQEWVWTGLILKRGGGFQLLNQLIDLILPSGFLVLLIGQQQGRGDVVDVPSAPSICANDDGEASLRGAVLVFLWKPSVHIPFAPSVYASDDGEAVRVFLSIPSVDVPSAPSICVNNDVYVNDDGKASLRGAVMIYIKDGLRIMVLKGLIMFRVQPGYFGILRRWYNDVGKGHGSHGLDNRGVQGLRCHPRFVGERDQAADPLHEKLHRNYPQYCRPRFDEAVARCCNEDLILGQGEWSHALLASVDPQVHGLVTTLVPRLIGGVATVRTRVLDARGSSWAAIPIVALEIGFEKNKSRQFVLLNKQKGRSEIGKVSFRSDWYEEFVSA
ncbi:hypothetical protein LguiA_017839 [Lonicera macranthoides]